MLHNYLIVAWRQLVRNKLYAAINILGLVLGLAVYLFSWLLVDYEEGHDRFFANAHRTVTVGTVFSPNARLGVAEIDGVHSAVGPLIEAEVEEVEAVARMISREFLLPIEDDHYY